MHSKDYTCLGSHQLNVNIRIVSVTTSSKNNNWISHLQYHVLLPMIVFARHWETILAWAHKVLWTGQQNSERWPAVQIPLEICLGNLPPMAVFSRIPLGICPLCKYRINTRFLPMQDVNLKRYFMEYCRNNGPYMLGRSCML